MYAFPITFRADEFSALWTFELISKYLKNDQSKHKIIVQFVNTNHFRLIYNGDIYSRNNITNRVNAGLRQGKYVYVEWCNTVCWQTHMHK